MGKWRRYRWMFAVAMLALIFVRPQQAVNGVQRAMRMWYTGVAPALLPFLAFLPLLTGTEACAAYRSIFSGVMGKLFHLPGEAVPAVITAMISGSPGGAAAICSVRNSGGITDRQAARIALATGGVSPAWLVLGVGCGMMGSRQVGVKLALIQLAVQLFLLKLLERVEFRLAPGLQPRQPPPGRNPMLSAVETTICVCGYMAVFGACGNVIASFAGEKAGTVLMTVLDLPSGVMLLSENFFLGRMAAVGAAVGFTGLCIAAQNMDALREIGVRWREYLAMRMIAAAMCALLSTLAIREGETSAQEFVKPEIAYVFSLLIASIAVLPALMWITNKLFLNKRTQTEKPA